MTPEKATKIIYEVIADKTLSEWQRISINRSKWDISATIIRRFVEIIMYNKIVKYNIYFNWWTATINEENIDKILWHPVYPHHILQRANKVWWNMVINNLWTILFNMAWTPKENWSYIEIRNYDLTKDFDWQSDETKIALWELVEKVLDNK